jgi:hypothetical protein
MDGGNMTVEIVDGVTTIRADEGRYITNGSVYGTTARFEANDSVEN